jgi:phytoene dehydrogenase-like protein
MSGSDAIHDDYDVVIIGAGHNGLTAGCYLAIAGLDVLVVEANDQIGGMSGSGTPIPNAPQHIVNYCALDLVAWHQGPVPAELEIHRYGLQTIREDPAYVYLHPDGASLAFWQDPRKTADEIRRFSGPDAEAFLEYARLLEALIDIGWPLAATNPRRPELRSLLQVARAGVRHRRRLRALGSFALSSGAEVIDTQFRHPITRAALYCVGAPLHGLTTPASTLDGITFSLLHRAGFLRPVGGMQAVPNALAARLRAAGGAIATGTPVAEILVRNDRAAGVGLADGREIRARHAVLATCDPKTALERLLPPNTLSPKLEGAVRNLPLNAGGFGPFKIDVATSGPLQLSKHARWRNDGLDLRKPGHLIGSPESIERSFALAAAGLLPDPADMAFWAAIPSAADPSQAPAGQDTVYIYTYSAPLQPEQGWKALKEEVAQGILGRMSEFYDGLTELEIGRCVESPDDLAANRGCTQACITHVDWTFNRMGPFRPAPGLGGYRLPIDGLYLGGSGSHPGAAVHGLSGRLSAREILRVRKGRARK